MRWWKDKQYKDGEWRTVKRFLLFPRWLPISSLPNDTKQYRWLETSRFSQKYHVVENTKSGYWEDICWYQS